MLVRGEQLHGVFGSGGEPVGDKLRRHNWVRSPPILLFVTTRPKLKPKASRAAHTREYRLTCTITSGWQRCTPRTQQESASLTNRTGMIFCRRPKQELARQLGTDIGPRANLPHRPRWGVPDSLHDLHHAHIRGVVRAGLGGGEQGGG